MLSRVEHKKVLQPRACCTIQLCKRASKTQLVCPLVTNGLSHPYHLDESISILGPPSISFQFFVVEIFVSKQNSPRWDAPFCGVTSGAILYICAIKWTSGLYGLKGLSVHLFLACIFLTVGIIWFCVFLLNIPVKIFFCTIITF